MFCCVGTNSIPYEVTADTFDGSGNITNRIWHNASGVVNRTQSLSYDAKGRLRQVTELNTNNYGFTVLLLQACGREKGRRTLRGFGFGTAVTGAA